MEDTLRELEAATDSSTLRLGISMSLARLTLQASSAWKEASSACRADTLRHYRKSKVLVTMGELPAAEYGCKAAGHALLAWCEHDAITTRAVLE